MGNWGDFADGRCSTVEVSHVVMQMQRESLFCFVTLRHVAVGQICAAGSISDDFFRQVGGGTHRFHVLWLFLSKLGISFISHARHSALDDQIYLIWVPIHPRFY